MTYSLDDGVAAFRRQRPLFEFNTSALGLDEYQRFTLATDQNPAVGLDGLPFTLLGLFGEAGSLLSELKKKQRDKDAYIAYRDSVVEEFGDCLWYLANTAQRAGLELSLVAHRGTSNISDWSFKGVPNASSFLDLQEATRRASEPTTGDPVAKRLIALAARVGHLLEDFSTGRIADNGDVLSADLIDIFRALVSAADEANISIDEAARKNMSKVLSRWPVRYEWGDLYDLDLDEDERLPRRFEMVFREKDVAGKKYVIQQCNGIRIGDRLTDNKVEQDDYRFHDVFHLAYAAVLGWSPVIRALFKAKRKSKPDVDENQDGARAILIEEGIATWIFNHGSRQHYFRNVDRLDYSLLKAVQELVKGYEVESRPLWQWERAILDGFRIFRDMQAFRGGRVCCNLIEHTITFSKGD